MSHAREYSRYGRIRFADDSSVILRDITVVEELHEDTHRPDCRIPPPSLFVEGISYPLRVGHIGSMVTLELPCGNVSGCMIIAVNERWGNVRLAVVG